MIEEGQSTIWISLGSIPHPSSLSGVSQSKDMLASKKNVHMMRIQMIEDVQSEVSMDDSKSVKLAAKIRAQTFL